MENRKFEKILTLLKEQKGIDFSGYRLSMLERRVQKRIFSTNTKNLSDYHNYLELHDDELDKLIDVFTINVSYFFRNSMAFEYIRKIVIPELLLKKIKEGDFNLRVWSAGCSFGEEPYSIAIILNEILTKELPAFTLNIFATDIDKKALIRAAQGSYTLNSIEKIKYGLLNKYFIKEGGQYKLIPEIKNKVKFSYFDLLDTNYMVPPLSIFGGFDLVLCRNVFVLKIERLNDSEANDKIERAIYETIQIQKHEGPLNLLVPCIIINPFAGSTHNYLFPKAQKY